MSPNQLFQCGSDGTVPRQKVRVLAPQILGPITQTQKQTTRWAERESNPRPSDYEAPALTTELPAQRQSGRKSLFLNRLGLDRLP